MKEVEITPHHRPTEWVKAIVWMFIFISAVLIIAQLFVQHPMSLGDFWSDTMGDFVRVVVLIILLGAAVLGVAGGVWSHRSKVVDVGPNGTYIISGQETIQLPPLSADMPVAPQTSVSLVTPSDKSGDYLSYVKIAGYLQQKGIEVDDLKDYEIQELSSPKDEQQQIVEGLTLLQTRVLESWNRGNHGRSTIHKDLPDVSERIASNTIIELETKGLIKRC
jgi:hypothetical protein